MMSAANIRSFSRIYNQEHICKYGLILFAALGNRVVALRRTAMGNLKLDESLESGAYRELTAEELALLK